MNVILKRKDDSVVPENEIASMKIDSFLYYQNMAVIDERLKKEYDFEIKRTFLT